MQPQRASRSRGRSLPPPADHRHHDTQWPGHVPDAGCLRRVRAVHDPGAHQGGPGEGQGAGQDLGSPEGPVRRGGHPEVPERRAEHPQDRRTVWCQCLQGAAGDGRDWDVGGGVGLPEILNRTFATEWQSGKRAAVVTSASGFGLLRTALTSVLARYRRLSSRHSY